MYLLRNHPTSKFPRGGRPHPPGPSAFGAPYQPTVQSPLSERPFVKCLDVLCIILVSVFLVQNHSLPVARMTRRVSIVSIGPSAARSLT